VSGCGRNTRLSDLKNSWKYLYQTVADSRQEMVLQLCGFALEIAIPFCENKDNFYIFTHDLVAGCC
jgi:hypothetical protein